MPSLIALLGAAGSGRRTLLRALRLQLQATDWDARVIVDGDDAWAAALRERPVLVLLLAPRDAAGEAQDLLWRQRLARAGIAFSVLHGDCATQLAGAQRLIDTLPGPRAAADSVDATASHAAPRWAWCCDRCSDSACEHRLFKALLQDRSAQVGNTPPA